MKKILIISLIGLLSLMTFATAEYQSWGEVVNDYFSLIYQTGNVYEPATSMGQVIDRIFEMKVQVLTPKPTPKRRGSGRQPSTVVINEFDITGDNKVNQDDLDIVTKNWGLSNATKQDGDLNADGLVDGVDYSIVLSYWTS